MSSSTQRPHWLRRNVDLFAATFIIAFAGIGTAATSWITSPTFRMDRWVVEPAIQSVRPHLTQIHVDTREVAFQIREDLKREIEQTRQQAKGDFCQMRKDMHEAGRDTARIRDDIRRIRSEIRDEIRSWFRHSDWR